MKIKSWFLLGFFFALIWLIYSQLSESKKRYLCYMSGNFPHLITRYFV